MYLKSEICNAFNIPCKEDCELEYNQVHELISDCVDLLPLFYFLKVHGQEYSIEELLPYKGVKLTSV